MDTDSEIVALKAVGEVLDALDEEARKRVLNWANSKYLGASVTSIQTPSVEEAAKPLTPENPTVKRRKAGTSKGKPRASKKSKAIYKQVKDLNLRPRGKKSARDFSIEKSPTNQKQKCVVGLYYLLNVLEIESAGIDHIYTFFKDCDWPVPSDLPNTLHQAGSAGWLDTADAKDIKITPMGENVVEHDLPKKQK